MSLEGSEKAGRPLAGTKESFPKRKVLVERLISLLGASHRKINNVLY